ncbi:hypothetical protein [Aminobacter aminovorans]|uniref:hypothetical protein n=1 Tax=Aminobacter aminovorans TaxID=83263 RepID=UPI001FDEDECC|nr:hypothetical protein [Aminobacter aminovorans]
MAVDHAGSLRHNLAIIEGDEEQVARGSEAGLQAERVDRLVEDVGGDSVEQALVARLEAADLDGSIVLFTISS